MNQNKLKDVPLVAVLLATHNPSQFIADQIESIKSQEGVRTRIYWGDYESSQSSKEYVRGLLKGLDFSEYKIYEPGPAANFFFLLRQANEEYIAFSDQDDIWLSQKLVKQIQLLEKSREIPSLVHSNSQLLIRGELKSRKAICNGHDFWSLAFANCCQGCTLMINEKARKIIVQNLPRGIIWHDWWIALVISLTGKIHFSEDTQVTYRIHNNNTIGLPSLIMKIRNVWIREPGIISHQIQNALKLYSHYNLEPVKDLQIIQGLSSQNRATRLKASLKDKKRRQNYFEDLLRRIAIIVRQP